MSVAVPRCHKLGNKMQLFENMKNETVGELEVRQPVLAKADEPIRRTVERMRESKLGCVIVVDDENKPAGVFTESMLTQLVNSTPEAIDDPVSQHAADHWPWVRLSDPVSSVLEALDTKNIRFLVVVDDDGRIAGLTGQKGLMEYVAEHFPGQVMVQRIGQKPFLHTREGA